MATNNPSKKVIYAALAGNLLVAVTKFIAALITGSSSMISEGVHSLVDTGNEALLLYGYSRASLRPDAHHPLGYGRELYFWSFIVALLLFALGAGVSFYEGILHVAAPTRIENVSVNYIVLACSFLFEGVSWWIALKSFRASKGSKPYLEAITMSKDPPSFMVLLEDTAALIGIVIAAAGIWAADHFGIPAIDGAASILIGTVLAVIAALLARESKGLLIGERASEAINSSVLSLAESQPGVEGANGVITVHLSPDQIVATLSLEFADALHTPQIEECVTELERRIREKHPQIVSLFVKPQTRRMFEARQKQRQMSGF
ncbi:cation diffusion facilitator family transporter [Nitrobacter sp. NHB1]|uniref:cation diffusion facilitator family transporter n=1 Tax=Nitrobacter sp. NHB1 TaxID=3119830 RepID=UPI0030007CBE